MPSRFFSPSISLPPNFPLILYSSFIRSNHPWQPFPFLVYLSFSFWIPPLLLSSPHHYPYYLPFPLSLPFSNSTFLSIISSSVTVFLLHQHFSSCAASNYSWHPCHLASFFFSHLLPCLPFLIFSQSAGPSPSTLYLPRIPFSPPPSPLFTIIWILSFLMPILLFLFSCLSSFFICSPMFTPLSSIPIFLLLFLLLTLQFLSLLSFFLFVLLPVITLLSFPPSLSSVLNLYLSSFPPPFPSSALSGGYEERGGYWGIEMMK